MKKILFLATMLFVVSAASAQEKTLVCIEKFKNNSSMNNITMNNLRNEIMQGIIEKKRVDVTDATSLTLPEGKAERLKALKEKDFEYLIEGTLNSVDQKKSSDGKNFIAEVNYTLTIIDVNSGLTKSSDTYKDSWNIGNTSEEAVLKAVEQARKRMAKFVDDKFKVEAIIKALDQIDEKKGAVKSCYITIGSAAGIEKGQIFEVFANVKIAGEDVEKKIGEVKAKEVMSPTLTLCDVKNGGEEIKKTFEGGITMTVVSRAKKDILGGFIK